MATEESEYLSIEQGAILTWELFMCRTLTNRRAAQLLGRDVTQETARRDRLWAHRKLEQLSRVLPIYYDKATYLWQWCEGSPKQP